jgi:hypothetical protein
LKIFVDDVTFALARPTLAVSLQWLIEDDLHDTLLADRQGKTDFRMPKLVPPLLKLSSFLSFSIRGSRRMVI